MVYKRYNQLMLRFDEQKKITLRQSEIKKLDSSSVVVVVVVGNSTDSSSWIVVM